MTDAIYSNEYLNISLPVTLTKDEDEMGVMTPELVLMHAGDGQMIVEGEGFMGQYSPLSKANLEEKLVME